MFHIEPSSINFTFYKCIEFDCGQICYYDRDYTRGTWYSLFNQLWWLLDQEVINLSTLLTLFTFYESFRWIHIISFADHCFYLSLTLWAAIYRWQQAVPPKMAIVKKLFMLMNFAYTLLVLNYSCVGFMVSVKSDTFLFFLLLLFPHINTLKFKMNMDLLQFITNILFWYHIWI